MPYTPISELVYQKTWMSPDDFPTQETSETQVRADMQYHPDSVKSYINNTLVTAINTLLAAVDQLVAGTVTDDSVYTAAIQDGAVTLAKMGSASVGTAQLVAGCVTSDKLSPSLAISQNMLSTGSVGNEQLAQDAVRTLHIKDLQVTLAKLASDVTAVALGGAAASHTHTKSQITDFAHTHTKSQITDFAHTHVKSDITDFAHTHVVADITDMNANQIRAIKLGTTVPTTADISDGEIWLQYDE